MAAANGEKTRPPIFVIIGDEPFRKAKVVKETLDALLPPEIDRSMALVEYDGSRKPEQDGPDFAMVADDLNTMPFLADRRVVVVKEADKFITEYREKLEKYLKSPSTSGVLILECRSLPKNTKLYKAAVGVGGRVIECKKLSGGDLVNFVIEEARERGKRVDGGSANRLVELIGQDQGLLANEVEKLALYVGDRDRISADDISALVGLTREEKIFAVMDEAVAGRLPRALALWRQVLETDPAAVFKSLGGIAYKLRRWLAAYQLADQRLSPAAIAPRVQMWGRVRELESMLSRISCTRMKRILAQVAELDAQAKVGARSIETGVEALLTELAT